MIYDDRILFFKISTVDGSGTGTMYSTAAYPVCSGIVSISQSGSDFYIVTTCGSTYVIKYDSIGENFSSTIKLTEPTVVIYDAFTNSGYFAAIGYWNPGGENGYIGSFLTTNIDVHPHFQSTSNLFFPTINYPIVVDTTIGKIFLSISDDNH